MLFSFHFLIYGQSILNLRGCGNKHERKYVYCIVLSWAKRIKLSGEQHKHKRIYLYTCVYIYTLHILQCNANENNENFDFIFSQM